MWGSPYCSMIAHPADTKGSISSPHTFWTLCHVQQFSCWHTTAYTVPYVHYFCVSPLVYPSALAKRDTHHCAFRKPVALQTSVLWATCKACREQETFDFKNVPTKQVSSEMIQCIHQVQFINFRQLAVTYMICGLSAQLVQGSLCL